MTESKIIDGVQEIQLDNWKKFFDLTITHFNRAPAYIYRGQADYSWPLESSLDRHTKTYPLKYNMSGGVPEYFTVPPYTPEDHLRAFKRAYRGLHGPNAPKTESNNEWWALGQHHGLKTPLLDWTRSPFAALFFAFEQEKVVNSESELVKPEFRGVYAISSVKEIIGETEMSVVFPNTDTNYRFISQAGIFIEMPLLTDVAKLTDAAKLTDVANDVETHVKKVFINETRRATFTKIKIPNKDRHDCLVTLNKMNINYMTLSPDIDGAARYVNSMWQPKHDDSIAHL